MTPEQKASIEQTSRDRAAMLPVPPPKPMSGDGNDADEHGIQTRQPGLLIKPVTIDDLLRRIIALENHPALAPKEEPNG